MIKNIKIFGERNSGTTFCNIFLQKNLKNVEVLSGKYNKKDHLGWKHGFPNKNLFNKKDTLFVFIIRDLYTWLNSMYHKPYHFNCPEDINKFLYEKLNISDKRKDHPNNTDPRESNTIVNLRYSKIQNYLNFFKEVENVIFINMEDLQQNKEKFIYFLSKTYNISIKKKIDVIEKHTKTEKKEISHNYKNIIPDKIKGENFELESFVNSLKKSYYFKVKN